MLSQRTKDHDEANALTRAVARARAEGASSLVDLTVGNPTTASLPYPRDAILAALAHRDALVYEPAPLGVAAAREAAAGAFARLDVTIDPRRVVVVASTSEAYAALMKILCDPGDQMLVPAPSYPLLTWLARFEGVELVPYPLVYADRWHVDLDRVRELVSPRTRAIVVVAPNNPTGSYLSREELAGLASLGLPIVSDEVFAPYPLVGRPEDTAREALAPHGLSVSAQDVADAAPMVFSLSGLSKLAGLPQMKAGWIGVSGDRDRVRDALSRLELVLDVTLSVSAPIQHALGAILEATAPLTAAIGARIRENLRALREETKGGAVSVLHAEGGWYAMLRLPETRSDEAWALDLLEHTSVLAHPGYLFDVTRGAHLVVSLLTEEPALRDGARRIRARVDAIA